MSKFLLTGATGFVGQEVARQLLAGGEEVMAIGRRAPKFGIEFIEADLRDGAAVNRALGGHSVDYILHIASLPGDTGDPQEMLDVNVDGCLHILEAARANHVKRTVVASSISAYEWYPATKFSPADYLPVDEEHPCRPRDMYSVTKRMQELLAITYFHQYKLPVACLRLTAVVGPDGQGGGRGWRQIAQELSEGKRVRIPHFSKEELCHYVDIRDVARMLIHTAQCDAADGEIFNCCAKEAVTGAQFAQVVRQFYSGITVECGFPWSMAQGGKLAFSMEKASRIMGFEPKYAMRDSVAYIKDWIDRGGLRQDAGRSETFGGGIEK